jgi:hypothetical protein
MTLYKKFLIFNLLTLVAISAFLLSCQENYNPVFSEGPDERLGKTLARYDSILLSAPNGWTGKLETKLGPQFFYYFNFKDEGKVEMFSDFNQTTAAVSKVGTWVVKALQRPTLTFDTYSYIHLPADPNGNVNGGVTGIGLGSDFQFAITNVTEDSIVLEGIQNGSKMILKKANPAEVVALTEGHLANMLLYINTHKNLRISLSGGELVPLALNIPARNMASQYLKTNGDEIGELRSAFNFTTTGISLTSAFNINGLTFTEIRWDDIKQEFYIDKDNKIINEETLYIFHPATPITSSIGINFSLIQIPENSDVNPYPGQSPDFINAYTQAKESMLTGQLKLDLRKINLVFDPAENKTKIEVHVTQNGAVFVCQYFYSYTLSDEGVLKLEFMEADGNGWAIQPDMFPLLSYLENDNFTMEYVGGSYSLMAGLFSVDNPGFSFTGFLGR